jgi:CheY-like chemotaxis protein
MLKILLVEDDHVQRDYVRDALAGALGAVVETKACEWDFQRDFDAIASNPPDVAVLDIMLRWASPSRDRLEPAKELTPYQAGLRCAKRLHEDSRTQTVRVILYSVLPKEDIPDVALPDNVTFVVKEPDCENLIVVVKNVSASLSV